MELIRELEGQRIGTCKVGLFLCCCGREVEDRLPRPRASCGCYNHRIPHAGTRYGQLCLMFALPHNNGERLGAYQCDCGESKYIKMKSVQSGNTRTCGCSTLKEIEGIPSGKHPLYSTWLGITRRTNPLNTQERFKDYQGKGILCCSEWRESFHAFVHDMGERPSMSHTVDRVDNKKGYFPDNCQWATKSEQNDNRCNSRIETHNGESKSIRRWERDLGFKENSLRRLLNKGYTMSEATNSLREGRL